MWEMARADQDRGQAAGRKGQAGGPDLLALECVCVHVYGSVVLSIFTLLCSRSSRTFLSCKAEAVPIKQPLPIPPAPAPGSHHSIFCLCEFDSSRDLIEVESQSICPSVTGVFPLAWCPPGSSMLERMAGFSSFLRLSNISESVVLWGHWVGDMWLGERPHTWYDSLPLSRWRWSWVWGQGETEGEHLGWRSHSPSLDGVRPYRPQPFWLCSLGRASFALTGPQRSRWGRGVGACSSPRALSCLSPLTLRASAIPSNLCGFFQWFLGLLSF